MDWRNVHIKVDYKKILINFLVIVIIFHYINRFVGIKSEISELSFWILTILIIAVHESVHILVGMIVVKNRNKVFIVPELKHLCTAAVVEGEYSKKSIVYQLLAPVVLITVGSIILALIDAEHINYYVEIVKNNAMLSLFDLYYAKKISKAFSGTTIFKQEEDFLYVKDPVQSV